MESKTERNLKNIFLALFVVIIVAFGITQFIYRDPYSYHKVDVVRLADDAMFMQEDGTFQKAVSNDMYFLFPRKNRTDAHVIITKIPEFYSEDMGILIFSGNQDLEIYVDDNLRETYCDEEYRYAGTYSTGRFVFVPLSSGDSNKNLKVIYRTTLKSDDSRIGVPLFGQEREVFFWILYKYVWQMISSILLMALGIMFIIYGLLVKRSHRSGKGITYLGIFAIITAMWLLCQSDMRQYYCTYISTADLMSSFCLMLMPIPMLFFFNELLKGEFQKIYHTIIIVCLVDIFINTLLTWMNVINLVEWLFPTRVLSISTGVLCIVTFQKFSGKENIEEPRAILIGMIGLIGTIGAEYVNRVYFQSFYVGKYVGYGILFFMLTLGYSAVRSMAVQEREYMEAVRANSIKSSFLANMSHEIRTPINTIMGMDEMILRENTDKDIEHYALNILNSGKILISLINDILDFSKMESGKMEIVPRRYDFAILLNDLVNSINHRADEKNLALELDIEESIPSILYGDDLRIKQAVTNILTNAVKYTNEGSITLKIQAVRLSLEEMRLYISVSDTGIGIKEEDKARMFESFVRLETNKNRKIEGTGLGMAITKQIVDLMQGQLNVESEYGKGSKFTVSFVQIIIDDAPIGNFEHWYHVVNSRTKRYVEQYKAKNVSLLVVDDNEMNLEVIKGLLKKTGARIETAESGYECLDMIAKKDYDLIFLDHMMPGMDGVETLKKIQELRPIDKTPIPVVALTANAISGAREEYLRYGFSDYISKPVEYGKLIDVLRKFLPEKFEKRDDIKDIQAEYEEYLEKNGIHMESAIKYAGDDLEQYIHLLEMFTSERAKEKKKLIQQYYNEKKWNDYLVMVHALKNSARTIGADDLADMAYEQEKRCKEEDYAYIEEYYVAMIEKWDAVVEIISTYLQKQNDVKMGKNSFVELTDDEWNVIVETLIGYLDTFKKKEAINLLDKLKTYRLDGDRQAIVEQTTKAVQEYDYEKAMQVLKMRT